MNLWVNRLRQLSILAVALFFLSCEDDTSFLGYKNPNSKFEGKYVEIPLTVSQLRIPMRTSNYYFSQEYNRLLVGRINDPNVGVIQTHAITQFYNDSFTKFPEGFEVDSVTLQLQFDLFTQGSDVTKNQTISVYEVAEKLDPLKKGNYIGSRPTARKDSLLATRTFAVNPAYFKEKLREGDDEPVLISLRFADDPEYLYDFADRLENVIRAYSTGTDSTFVLSNKFFEKFKGLYLESSASDEMAVSYLSGGLSGLVVHYHTPTQDSLQRKLTFVGPLSYSHIIGEEANKYTFYQEVAEAERAITQAGTGLVAKLDLSKFYEFASQDSVKDMLLNSAQLVIEDLESSTIKAPDYLVLKALDENNRFRQAVSLTGGTRESTLMQGAYFSDFDYFSTELGRYVQVARIENDSSMVALADGSNAFSLSYSDRDPEATGDERYSGFLTLLFQRLYSVRNEPERFTTFALVPTDATGGTGAKTLKTAVFPSNKVTLRIFYTKPTFNNN
jgi:hypothetical protein